MRTEPHIERLLTTLQGGKADRVPNFEIVIDKRNLRALLGRDPSGQSLWDIPPEEAKEAVESVGQDAIPCPLQHHLPKASIQRLEDIEQAEMPPMSSRREKLERFLSVTRQSDVGVCLCLSGPFTAACMASGPTPIESFLLMVYQQPETVEKLLDFYTAYTIGVIEEIADLSFDFYYIGDDVTGFVGPDHLDELWARRHEQIIRTALDTDRPILAHCCGSMEEVLPYFDKWGVHAVHPLQPDMNDIYAVREQYPDLAVVGNISVNDVLSFGSPEDVAADTLEHLRKLAPHGGYVVGSSHSIIDSIPPGNYRTMVETTWNYDM